jgi:hypothetical protein
MTDIVNRKILMQPFKPQGWSAAAVIIGLAGAFIGFLFIQGGGIGVILSLGVFLATFVLSTAVGQATRPSREKKIMAGLTSDARKAMIDYIGREPKYIHTQGCASRSHAGCVVGTGIAYDGQNIYILDDGEIGKIPWKLVRSWQWSIEGYDSVKVYSIGVPVAARASAQLQWLVVSSFPLRTSRSLTGNLRAGTRPP